MCLISFAWKHHPKFKFILLANRDEFYDRLAQPARYWSDDKKILAGRDLHAGGTWLGMHKNGKLAAITNYRDLKNIKPEAPSRGKLTLNFLKNNLSAPAYAEQLKPESTSYNGFNLLLLDQQHLWYVSNVSGTSNPVKPGLYGLSNHLLDTPWPKVAKAKNILADFDQYSPSQLLDAFANRELAADHDLPDTGVGQALERKLSAMFIHFENYGTRSTTLITIDYEGRVQFRERTFMQAEKEDKDALYKFNIPGSPN
ncbi:MAG: NRDE family protein [Cyclobacteriaceae bacterium]